MGPCVDGKNYPSSSRDPVNVNATPLAGICPGSVGDQVTAWRELKAHKTNRLMVV